MAQSMGESGEKSAAQPDGGAAPDGAAPGGASTTPAAEQADRQDKTKDKPDSGQNEDG